MKVSNLLLAAIGENLTDLCLISVPWGYTKKCQFCNLTFMENHYGILKLVQSPPYVLLDLNRKIIMGREPEDSMRYYNQSI